MPSLANLVYTSHNDFNVAKPCSLPVFECPFADMGVNERLVLRQDFIQNLADFAALALGTAHPDYATYILVEEGAHADLTGGKVRWTRTYAEIPDSFTRPAGNFNYSFPGFTGAQVLVGAGQNDREPFTKSVPIVIVREFTLDPTPGNVEATTFHLAGLPNYFVNLLDDGPPDGLFITATSPTRTDYEAMIANDAANPNDYSIIVETRAPAIWMGGIYVRETMKTKAI